MNFKEYRSKGGHNIHQINQKQPTLLREEKKNSKFVQNIHRIRILKKTEKKKINQ